MRLFIPLNIFFFLLLFSLPGTAQNCDCDDNSNCPAAFGPNFTGQICYDITDALNDDLADPSQGICGVSIVFTHQHIWDLELSLISPAGQVVPLVGYNTNYFGTTNNVLWNVLFIPCANVPAPDTINGNPFQAMWTNNQSWPFAAIFNGSYHPVGGNCLESFNTGPVNGTWCLQIDNQPSPYSGEILNFEVILCDNSGLLCCDADGGVLNVSDFAVCQGDSSLLIDWQADYGPIYPSPAEYGYLFTVSDTSGTILLIDTAPDLTGYAPGTYTVCGLSYLLTDSLNIPAPDGVLTVGELENNLTGAAPWFCGDLTNICVEIQIVPPPAPVFLSETICADEFFQVGDSLLNEPGQYTLVLQNAFQCDSVVNLDLTVLAPDSVFLIETVCFGGTFPVGDSLYAASGNYTTLLENMHGCDSLVFLDLTVLDEIETFLVDTICQGENYAVGDSLFSETGAYSVLLQSQPGCDSTVFLDLTVLDPQAIIAIPDTLTCSQQAVVLDGSASSSGAGVTYQWTALSGALDPPLDGNQATALGPGEYELLVMEYFCPALDTVEVIADTLPPVAVVLPADPLTCVVDSVLLDGTGSDSGVGFALQWFGPAGGILPGAVSDSVWVQQPGEYALVVTRLQNGCTDSSFVLVQGNFLAPFVDAGPGSTLNCQDILALLDGSATYQDGNFAFEWVDPQGVSLPWTDSLQVEVDQAGWYFLNATDLENGCMAVDSVLIVQDTVAPLADAGAPDTLTCLIVQLNLDGSGSSNSGMLEFSWETLDGNLVGPPTLPDPEVDAPGTYLLTVTDPVNFCEATDSVTIVQDVEPPMADAGPTVTLNCNLKSWSLGNPDNTSLGPEFTYLWIGPNGDSISAQLSPEIHTGGTYYLYVTNIQNGCTSVDSVFIEQEEDFPVAVVGPGGTLTCSNPAILLDGSGSTAGPFIEYAWLDAQGNVIGQTNQLSVGNAGVYCLVVENGFNFCRDTACVEVFQGPGFPLVDAGPNEELNCLSGQAFLQGTVQPVLPEYELSWSTSSGNILSGSGQLAIIVDEPGWYTLTVNDTVNNCIVQDSALVVLDTAACQPIANGGPDGLVNCYNLPFDTLNASQGTSTGINIEYLWTPIGGTGTVFSGENTLSPVVTDGTFLFCVTNTSVNISTCDTVVVYFDVAFPQADAGPDQTIDCSTISNNFYLDGSGSTQGDHYIYEWSSDGGGFIISGVDSLFPLIGAPGLYDLQVTDTLNGCASTDAVLITLDGDTPTPCVAETIQIPCGATSFITGDTCSENQPYSYQWIVTGGTFLSDPAQPLVEVAWSDSLVQLTGLVIDTTNFCPVAVQIELFAPEACYPDCAIAQPDTLTCDVTAISLDGTGSSVGPEFMYAWQAVSGHLCGGETTLFPCVDAPGQYVLTITDTSTLFTCTEAIWVLENTAPPPVDAGPNGFLTCDNDQVVLQAVPDSTLSYSWTAAGGPACILSGGTTTSPTVYCPGVYYLTAASALTGCVGIDSVAVLYDTLPPVAAIQIPDTLTCTNTSVLITSQGSSLGADITYQWTLNNAPLATGLGSWTATQPGTYCLRVINENTGCSSQACGALLQFTDPPPVQAGPDTSLTCGITSLTLNGSPGAGGNFTLFWTTTDGCIQSDPTLNSVSIDCPGTYQFEVTDTLTGCSAFDSLFVAADTLAPEAIILPPDPLTCLQTQVGLDGSSSLPSGELTFSWSTFDGNFMGATDEPIAWVDLPGIYQLVVQNTANQCKDSVFLVLEEEVQHPVADAGPDTSLTCFAPVVQLNGAGSSQGLAYTYSWTPPPGVVISGGANTLFPIIDQPGIYTLQVVDTTNSCVTTDEVLIVADTASPQAIIETMIPPVITCTQATVPLSGLLSQPAGLLDFTWQTQGGQIQGDPTQDAIEALEGGIYSLIVQNQINGCLDTTFISVNENLNPPQIQLLSPDTLTCIQTSVLLDASGTTASGVLEVVWTGPGPILDSLSLTPSVGQVGTYLLEVVDLENGCIALDSVTVFQDTLAPQAQAQADGAFDCEVATVGLDGSGSSVGPVFTYTWTSQSGDPIEQDNTLFPIVSQPGIYTLTVVNGQNGCLSSTSVEVFAEAFPIVGLNLELILPSCFEDRDGGIWIDTVLGGMEPFQYSFEGSAFYPYTQFNYLAAGTYSISVEDTNGCRFDTLVFLPNPNQLSVDLGPDQYIQLGETAWIEAIPNVPDSTLSSVDWLPWSDPDCPECLAFEAQPLHTTTFAIDIQDENGCIASDHMTVFVEKAGNLYLGNAFSPNGDGENDIFFPQCGPEVSQIQLLQIFDRWGNLVYQAENFPPNDPAYGWDGTFENRPLNTHIFVWQARIILRDGTEEWYKGDVLLAR
ncbi:MAG: gliding motility-associated C-terminal domain-containing protein [Lewinellaceae bacterium]|nr:gliding motility-associated C-terminal domain-containing protein [Lewinellaceae bacterium]